MSFPIYVIAAVIVIRCNGLSDKSCDRIKIENNFYDIHVLWTDLGRPYNLNVHKLSNTLFFSFSVPETYSEIDFQLVQLNIDTKENLNIAGIKGGCATAIDQGNDEIYLGGSDGIYKYNMATKLADFYKEKDKNIWALFHRRNLFYVSYPEQRLYMEIDGNFAIVKEFQNFDIDQFHSTSYGQIYFANNTGFYKYNKTKLSAELIHDLVTVRQISEDNTGRIYICTNFGLFIVKDTNMVKILNMKNIYGLAFDRDNNFVISDHKRVMRLLKSNQSCIENDHW